MRSMPVVATGSGPIVPIGDFLPSPIAYFDKTLLV
jgi:hypothetical protein